MRNYKLDRVIADLNKKHDCNIDNNISGIGGRIQLLFGKQAKGDVGIKSRGKINYLENVHGFRKEWINPDVK